METLPTIKNILAAAEVYREAQSAIEQSYFGYVVVYWDPSKLELTATGWTRELSEPERYKPGVYFVKNGEEKERDIFTTIGGDPEGGATEWVPLHHASSPVSPAGESPTVGPASFWQTDAKQAPERLYVATLDRVTIDFPQESAQGIHPGPSINGPLNIKVSALRLEGLDPAQISQVREQFDSTLPVCLTIHPSKGIQGAIKNKHVTRCAIGSVPTTDRAARMSGGELPDKQAHVFRTLWGLIQKEADVYEVLALSLQEDGTWLYLIKTPFSSWPKFVIGETDVNNGYPSLILKFGNERLAWEEWNNLNAGGIHP